MTSLGGASLFLIDIKKQGCMPCSPVHVGEYILKTILFLKYD
jgi:hypothetical protein